MPRVKKFDEQEVLQKAMQLFWEKGYFATSIQDLVNHLGINRASLYETYGGKKELFNKSFQLYRSTNVKGVIAFFETQPDVRKGFKALFDILIEEGINDHDRKGCFVVNTTTELIPGDEKILSIINDNKKSFEKLFYDYLKKGEAQNQFEKGKDLKLLAFLLFTLYNGLKVITKVDPNRDQISKSVDAVLSFLD